MVISRDNLNVSDSRLKVCIFSCTHSTCSRLVLWGASSLLGWGNCSKKLKSLLNYSTLLQSSLHQPRLSAVCHVILVESTRPMLNWLVDIFGVDIVILTFGIAISVQMLWTLHYEGILIAYYDVHTLAYCNFWPVYTIGYWMYVADNVVYTFFYFYFSSPTWTGR